MTVLSKLRKAISLEGYGISMDSYEGKEDRYIVYNVVAESPGAFADNEPTVSTISFQIHIYLPRKIDYRTAQEELKKRLRKEGFSYPEAVLNILETDKTTRHICLETNIDTEV